MQLIPRFLPEAAHCLRPHLRMLEAPAPKDQQFAKERLDILGLNATIEDND